MTPSSKPLLIAVATLLLAACGSAPVARQDAPGTVAGKPADRPSEPVKQPDVSKSPAEQFEDALAALKAKRLPEARAGFELLARQHPEFSGPLTNLAILDAKSNAREAAINGFNRAIVANPRNAVAHNWLGILYRESRNYARAEQEYLKSLELNPDNAAVVLNLAILYDLYLKQPENALTRYRDYQRMTNQRELKVAAWIKALEATAPPPPTPAPATTAAPKS